MTTLAPPRDPHSSPEVAKTVQPTYAQQPGYRHFWLRRLHSLLGLVFGAYVTVHLLVNLTGFWPRAYQQNVDKIHQLEPMLPLIELVAIFIPLLFHMIYGVYIANAGVKFNTTKYNYGGNVRYFLQRITSYILLVFLIYHVGTLHKWGFALANNFVSTPPNVVQMEKKLADLKPAYDEAKKDPAQDESDRALIREYDDLQNQVKADRKAAQVFEPSFNPKNAAYQSTAKAIKVPYGDREALNVGVIILYLLGIWAAVFHWANGLWTSAIAWGLTVTAGAQKRWGHVCLGFGIVMLVIGTGSWAAFAVAGKPDLPESETWTMSHEEAENVHGQATGGRQSGGPHTPPGVTPVDQKSTTAPSTTPSTRTQPGAGLP